MKKIIGLILGVVLAVVILMLPIPEKLNPNAMLVLSTLVCAIVFWIFDVIPDYIVGVLMCTSWVILSVVPFDRAFSQFANSSWWMIIGAICIGHAVSSTGLMKRIALNVMKFFPTTFKGQTMAILLSGVIVAPTIPSTNAKGSIAAPLSLSISDTMGYKRGSNASAGLFMAMFFGFVCTSPIFLSATFMNYVARGLVDKGFQDQMTWINWFIAMLPWAAVFLIGGYIAINVVYKPQNEAKLPDDFIKQQLQSCGPISKKELMTLGILLVTLVFWMLERVTGISSAIVALVAMSLLVTLKILSAADFKNGIPWTALIFIGCALNLGTVLPTVGIDKWLSATISPYVQPILNNIYLLVILFPLVIYVIRFFLVALTAAVTIVMLMVTPFLVGSDISPFVFVIITVTSVNIWVLKYQNPPFLTTYYAIDGVMASEKQTSIGSIIYMVLNIIGLVVSIPVWKMLGLL